LLNSILAHEQAVTPELVRSAFKNRGIVPWDSALILANALLACPAKSIKTVHSDILDLCYSDRVIEYLRDKSAQGPTLTKKQVTGYNAPILAENLLSPSSVHRRLATKPIAKKSMPKPMIIDSETEQDLSDGEEEHWLENMMKVGTISEPPISQSCSHCNHTRSAGSVDLACYDCKDYYLCLPCQTNTNALQEHMKSHPEALGRPLRPRSKSHK